MTRIPSRFLPSLHSSRPTPRPRWPWSAAALAALFGLGLGAAGCHPQTGPERAKAKGLAKGAGGEITKVAIKDPDKNPDTGLKRFSVLVAKAKERKGFFDTYQKGDELYLAVPKARLGEDFLLYTRLARGVGQRTMLSGASIEGHDVSVVAFERHGDRLFLVQRPTRVTAPPGSPLARSVEQSYSGAVLQSAPVESERPDGAPVVNIKGWVTGDLSQVGRLVGALTRTGGTSSHASTLSSNKERSFIESVKDFPENLNVRASLTFTPSEPSEIPTLANERFISVSVYYTFAKLPSRPMVPRSEDDRIGYFIVTRLDPSSQRTNFIVRNINRWRLEPSGQLRDGLRVPKQPIVFYIDPSFPTEYRPFVQEGVEVWQRAFAAAGWYQAVRAEQLPKDADVEDLRYPTIRWDTSHSAPLGRGQLVADPRTGEILGASIIISMHLLQHYREEDLPYLGRRVAGESTAADFAESMISSALRRPSRRPGDAAAGPGPGDDEEGDGSNFSLHMSAQNTLMRTSLLAGGMILPSEKTPLRMLGQSIKFTAMHEVGHVLGLRHNFKSSSVTPLDKLADPAWVREHGLVGSVMDYPGLNLPRGPAPADWYYYPPGLGPSDLISISYGYVPEDAKAREIARQAAKSGHVFGTDEDARSSDAGDPMVQDWDLSSDPLLWARDRVELIQLLWQKLPERVLFDNEPYGELTDVLMGLVYQYASTVDIALRYVGGQFQTRDHVGDPDGRPPFSMVPKVRQQEALDFLNSYVFSATALAFPADLLTRLGPRQARSFELHHPFVDVPLGNVIRNLQGSMLVGLLTTDTIQRMRNSEAKYGAAAVLTIPELMAGLTQGLWSELLAPTPGSVVGLRRDLQRRHLERLSALVLKSSDRDNPDMRALARYQLTELKRRLTGRERAAGLDAYTRAHVVEVQARIAKVLDAHINE